MPSLQVYAQLAKCAPYARQALAVVAGEGGLCGVGGSPTVGFAGHGVGAISRYTRTC